MNRFKCMKILANKLKDELIVISLGEMVDEWDNAYPGPKTLYAGALGINCGVAIGLAKALPHRKVICLDSDGSMLLDLGCLPVLGNERPKNLIVIVWDNEIYGSLYTEPPLPTHTSKNVNLAKMAEGAGIENSLTVRTEEEFEKAVTTALSSNELYYIVAKHDKSPAGIKLKRKRSDAVEDKYRFLRYIEESEGLDIKPPCRQL